MAQTQTPASSTSASTVRAGPSSTSLASTTSAQTGSGSAFRSERILRDMLQKDGAARSRSLSRGSSSAAGIPQYVPSSPPPPLPTSPKMVPSLSAAATRVLEESATQRESGRGRDRPTVSRNSSDQSLYSTEERPLFAANGPGGPGLLLRPTLPAPRKTHDGVIPQKSPPPSLPHHHSGHGQMARHQTAPSAPLSHNETAPLPTTPFKNSHNVHQPVARPYTHTQLPPWSYEGGESSSPTSYSPHSDTMLSSGSPSGSSSGVSSTQQPCTPSPYGPYSPGPATAFDLQSANAFCRQQSGYISFGDIEGLGRPLEDEEDERRERERLEAEQRKKRGFWGWIEDATHTGMGGLVSRPKTPSIAQQAQA